MTDCYGVTSSTDTNQPLYNFDESDDSKYPYRELIGSLMYLSVGTRPDICHAVGMASCFLESPKLVHEKAAKRIVRYIKKTLNFGIYYPSSKSDKLKAFTDADYAGCLDTGRSTSGYAFVYGGIAGWGSERQKSVALSTAESEYMAGALCVQELVWLWKMFCEILDEKFFNLTLYMDNTSAIRLVKNPEFHKRSKHIDVRYHFIREKYDEGLFTVDYVPTKQMLADIFTKALTPQVFCELVSKLNIVFRSKNCNCKCAFNLKYQS